MTVNQVTVVAALGSIAVGTIAFIWGRATPWLFLLIPAWFLLRTALNAADGTLAREFGQKSALGADLDELRDVVADAALNLPFTHCIPWGIAGALGTMVGGATPDWLGLVWMAVVLPIALNIVSRVRVGLAAAKP